MVKKLIRYSNTLGWCAESRMAPHPWRQFARTVRRVREKSSALGTSPRALSLMMGASHNWFRDARKIGHRYIWRETGPFGATSTSDHYGGSSSPHNKYVSSFA